MTKPLRCAVYTRKSTEEGLDQAFNSLHAQREACEAYVKSQAAEGWKLEKKHYDDGGYSGGTLDRPALQELLQDIERGLVNVIVVYKIDRLSRSLADFARLVELFEAKGVTFVSVTQHFNTTTSMGRLTLNVLLSFAQFEREVTGERIRDKIAASKRKGMWMGGTVPLGYDLHDRKLILNESEAKQVRLIFQLYLEVGAVSLLAAELRRQGMHSKVRVSAKGVRTGGHSFLRGQLYAVLRNRTYLGEVAHRGHVYAGEHEAIVERKTWDNVQSLLAKNRRKDFGRRAGNPKYLLTGLLFDDRGNAMTPHHTQKKGAARYSYYVSQALVQNRTEEAGNISRIPVTEIDTAVELAIKPLLDAGESNSWLKKPIEHRRDALRTKVLKIELGSNEIRISLKHGEDVERLSRSGLRNKDHTIFVPFIACKRGGQRQIHLPPGTCEGTWEVNPAIAQSMCRAWKWRRWLEDGEVKSFTQIAKRDRCTEAYIRKLLPMAFLAPDIIDSAIRGKLPRNLKIADLARHDMPLEWDAQRRQLGLVAGPR